MKKRVFLAAVLICMQVISVGSVVADVPPFISYQGKLTAADGSPLPNGEYKVSFAVYPRQDSMIPVWSEETTVQLTDGLFMVNLGMVTPIPNGGFAKGAWLGIKVDNQALSPRVPLLSAPYALRAHTSENVADTAAVTTLNSLTGNITLQAGANITLEQNGNILTLSGESIPNPLPVTVSNIPTVNAQQSGNWNVQLSGTPTVNSPVKTNEVQLWTTHTEISPAGSITSPVINCSGYREARIVLATQYGYSEPEKIRYAVLFRSPALSWVRLGFGDFATPAQEFIPHANFKQDNTRAILTVPVLSNNMWIQIRNDRSTPVSISNVSWVYLID